MAAGKEIESIYKSEFPERFDPKTDLLKSDDKFMYINYELINNIKDIKDTVEYVRVRLPEGEHNYVAIPKATSSLKLDADGNLIGYSFKNKVGELIEIIYKPEIAFIYNKRYQKQVALERAQKEAAEAAEAAKAEAEAEVAALLSSHKQFNPNTNQYTFYPGSDRAKGVKGVKGGKRRHTKRRKSRKACKSRK
jgi:hypothetical protein